MINQSGCPPVRALLAFVATVTLTACTTAIESPSGERPSDKLRKADSSHNLHGDLEITISRTR